MELCGLDPAPQPLDGLSFAPLLSDPTTDWKHSAFNVWGIDRVARRSIKTAQYDYIDTSANPLHNASIEVYDLAIDPSESVNLYAERPEVATVLAERLRLGPDAAKPDAPPIPW
ncbi:MAG: hypothetical protein ABIX10_01810 [Acidimicrobiales bacterium]